MVFDPLADQFHEAMLNVYRRAKAEANYPANDFLAMVNCDGGLATAKKLINAQKESSGYAALFSGAGLI